MSSRVDLFGADGIKSQAKKLFPNCKGCIFLDTTLWGCGYARIRHTCRTTGDRAAKTCPGGGCDLKQTRKPRELHPNPILTTGQKKKLRGRPTRAFHEELARQLYIVGANDVQIALALGVNRQVVMRWRHKNDFPSNYDPKNQRKE